MKLYKLYALVIILFSVTSGYSQIQKKTDSLKNVIQLSQVDSVKINALESLVYSYIPNKLDSARYYQKELKQLSTTLANVKGNLRALSAAARIEYLSKNYKKALDTLDVALQLAIPLKDETITAPLIRKKVMNLVKLKDYKNAIVTGDGYLKNTTINEIPIAVRNRLYFWLGEAYITIGEKEKTLDYYNEILKSTDKELENIGLFVNMAITVSNKGDIISALEYLMPILDIVEQKPLESYNEYSVANDICRLYRIQGSIYLKQKSYEKSLKAYDKAIQISKQASLYFNAVNSLYSQAVIYQKTNRDEQSRKALEEGYKIALQHNITSRLYHFAIKIGYANKRLLQYDKAVTYFSKGVNYAIDNKNNLYLANAYASLGEVYLEMKNYEEARNYIIKSKQTYDKQENYTMDYGDKLLYHKSLYVVDSTLGNYKASLKNFEQYIIARDSVNDTNRMEQIDELQTKYETEKKEKAIALLQKEYEVQKLKETRYRNEKIVFIIGLLSLLGILFFVYRSYKSKSKSLQIIKKQNIDIIQKNKENQLLTQEMHHRVKNNLQIIMTLLSSSSTKANLENSDAKEVLLESQNKIKTMALIHQDLYASKTQGASEISVSTYFKNLIDNIKSSYTSIDDLNVDIRHQFEDITVPIKIGVPLGLVVNELLTNAIKYAFNQKEENVVHIAFAKADNGKNLSLVISDNGKGFENDHKKSSSFGLTMVRGLVEQLDGSLEITENIGVAYSIIIPND